MILLRLAFRSLCNRAFATWLTVISISLSVALLLTVERARRAAEDGFTQTISQTDLIVGARSGPLQLILYTVFNMGNATHNISYQTYEEWKKNPAIDWTIPYSLGDGHRGFRVVGTTQDFFTHYRFRGQGKVEFADGTAFAELWDVVIGSEVAAKLRYQVGNPIVVSHGAAKEESFQQHSDKPFRIVGILKPTGTPLDRAIYISLAGMEALHLDWQSGAAPSKDKALAADQIKKEDIKIHSITSFFLRTKSRIETLRLQREINNYKEEPLLAIIPGATLQELWHNLGYVEQVLKMISVMVIVVGFMAMLIALTTTLNERRLEMAILRSLGAHARQIVLLLVFESTLLTILGIGLGTLLSIGGIAVLTPWLENQFGLYLVGKALTAHELLYLVLTFVGGVLIGLVPALRAMKSALKDGLSVQV